MSFLSMSFALFAGIVAITYHVVPVRLRQGVLLAASLLFYATHGLGYLALLVAVSMAACGAALLIERASEEATKKRIMAGSVLALVVLLCGFKLAGALAPSQIAAQAMQEDAVWRFVLPLGLSYYLFKLVSYVLEVYWENIPAQRSPVAVGLYASFFPQIVSGPIQRPGDFFAQLRGIRQVDAEDMANGLRRILFGLFKKVAIADRLAPAVAALHAAPDTHSRLELLFGAYAFAIQLYADFSALTDIAIGIGLMLGIRGPENFSLPFYARNLQEYWRRWHMSLTSWLADYLFTPLRMTLRDYGQVGLAAAVFLNMVAIGVWHGFSGPYLAFGAFHGVALAASVLTLKRRDVWFRARPGLAVVRKLIAPLVTFHIVVLGLILFRADSLHQALQYLASMVGMGASPGVPALRFALPEMPLKLLVGLSGLVVLMETVHFASRQAVWRNRFLGVPRGVRWAAYYGLIAVVLVFSRFDEGNFIYGQF